MKKNYLLISTATVLIVFTACKSKENTEAMQDATSLNMYVDSVKGLEPVYTVENWTAINDGYQERAMKAEKSLSSLEASDKAKAEASRERYAALKADYEAKLKENEMKAATDKASSDSKISTLKSDVADYRTTLRNNLFGEGKIGSDMQFNYVTAANILTVYDNFVNTVADNKKLYTREDWDEINVLYEALDNRKNSVEKDLASNDNRKIAGLKIRFASIAATHRGGTKVKENSDSKK